ncbi:MAG TPA: hypothetical protein VEO73_02260 [Gemmatimonadales bacterium]|nr:hypothetical protein [Gemmatimonadales bacterium]
MTSTENLKIGRPLPESIRNAIRVSYALRRVPESHFQILLPRPEPVRVGDIVLARVESIGKNVAMDIATGRRCGLHRGDLVAVVFGNRYATLQFEGYARSDGDSCDLLSVGGLCGLVASKHDTVPEPSKLRIEGALGDANGEPLRLQNFALPDTSRADRRPRIAVVLGTAMDAGKTHTARSVILGLRRQGIPVAGIKLTGTAAGRDTFTMLDAGACVALDFVDGGLPSTYRCGLPELLQLYRLLVGHAATKGASWVVVEIADGIIQGETAALLASTRFATTVDAWLLAATDALGAAGALGMLRGMGISPLAVSGIVSRSALGRREVEASTKIACLAAAELEEGALNAKLLAAAPPAGLKVLSGEQAAVTLG